MTKKKNKKSYNKIKALIIILLIPVAVTVFTLTAIIWNPDLIRKSASALIDMKDHHSATPIPEEYVSIYKEAAETYGIPWTLLAAHHRIETRFSKMDPLLSPAGAEGHMQFMPCTFVGWGYPGCSGLGKGEIPEADKTNPEIIKQYGGHGVDANGDGIADPYDIEDAIFSAANYLSKSGAAEGEYEKAIFDYNHSEKYVQDVLFYFNEYETYRVEMENK
ncbi:lytic transglycosylase domain-containing protein [Sporosarcina sp. NPDC096371]|uniref:lytic transglycosylase domain-containing protein n=1 Tax=Sporosarcina sp. NPDC096371 TaxID=3364530 RepID=UPI00381D8267